MIVLDTSAVVAIFRQEPDAGRFALAIAEDDQPRLSAANLLETTLILRGLKAVSPRDAETWLDEFLGVASIEVEAVTPEQAGLARQAHARFGKGTGHPAQLNFGDCFAYGLAKSLGAPLLFKGGDFAQTDLAAAL